MLEKNHTIISKIMSKYDKAEDIANAVSDEILNSHPTKCDCPDCKE